MLQRLSFFVIIYVVHDTPNSCPHVSLHLFFLSRLTLDRDCPRFAFMRRVWRSRQLQQNSSSKQVLL